MLHNYLSHFIRNLIAYRNIFNLRLFSLPHASTLDLHPKSIIIWSNRLKKQSPFNNKPEKEEKEEEDGLNTRKRAQSSLPPEVECAPAPERGVIQQETIEKRRKNLTLPPIFKI